MGVGKKRKDVWLNNLVYFHTKVRCVCVCVCGGGGGGWKEK